MIRICILLFTIFSFLFSDILAQQSGKLFMRDSSYITITDFTKIRSELYTYQYSPGRRKKGNATVDFIKDYSPDKIKTIRFKYEKGIGTDQFYYQLLIVGTNAEGRKYRRKIGTWDWLEMKVPGSNGGRDTEIIFFTEDKKLELDRIEFDPSE
ncbi:MAG: hypothetical protein H6538_00925 [Bacteroidales bacterium]|nr:hypothetical protein [Bacteroidales bacterium]MCB8999944.1 hypothetical protein [Bacteroidales bacterium]MCB9012605.1 hypothetical protein [Bacteroidales bacterium]